MRRTAVQPALVILLNASMAVAQPVTQPEADACKVRIALAPAEVRAEIEAWVRAEPRCEKQLEIRVIPTDDGLYLSASDQYGHVRERVVPDAQSAAVLVVSWMADDSLGPTFQLHGELEAPTPTERAPLVAVDTESPTVSGPPGLVRRAMTSSSSPAHWLTLGAITSSGEHVGVRGQLDLIGGRRFSIGVAGGWRPISPSDDGGMQSATSAGQARLVVGASHSFGRITLRAQLGLGVDLAATNDRMESRVGEREHGGTVVVPKAEAGVFAKVRVTDRWGLVGGPVVDAAIGEGAHPSVSAFLGVQWGL